MSEWIDAKHKLPEFGDRVLGCKGPSHMEGMELVESDAVGGEPYFIYLSDGDGPVENVTHWMHLPAPPNH